MKSPLLYILETLFCSGLFMLLWRMFLAERVSYRAGRVYLLCSMAAAAAIPTLSIPVYPADTVAYEFPLIAGHDAGVSADNPPIAADVYAADVADNAADWLPVLRRAAIMLTIAVSFVSVAMIVVNIFRIIMLRRTSSIVRECGCIVAENERIATPFVFFSTVFLPSGLSGRVRYLILCHERSHVRHRHTVERMAMEFLCGESLKEFLSGI